MSYPFAPNAAEMRDARGILLRKAEFDISLAREAEDRGDYATAYAYRQRAARLDRAIDTLTDCLEGILTDA